jgi:hypothetical protein
VDGEHRQRPLHGYEAAKAAVAGFQFQAGQPIADGVGAGAPVAVEVHAEHPKVAEFLRELPGQGRGLEPAFDVRSQPGFDELAHRGGDVALIGVQ